MKTARYLWPVWEAVTAKLSVTLVAPAMSAQVLPSLLTCHCTVGAGDPEAVAVKVASDPEHTVWSTGWAVIAGATTHGFSGEDVLRGFGAPAPKSARLLSVSAHPELLRSKAVVLEVVGAAAPSKKLAVPHPTRSTIIASCAGVHGVDPPLQASPMAELTRITFPAVADMAVVPLASGDGSKAPIAPPEASCTR